MQSHAMGRAAKRAIASKSESGPERIARLGATDLARLTDDSLIRNETFATMLSLPLSSFHALRKRQGSDFPPPVRIGARLRWRFGSVKAWIAVQERAA